MYLEKARDFILTRGKDRARRSDLLLPLSPLGHGVREGLHVDWVREVLRHHQRGVPREMRQVRGRTRGGRHQTRQVGVRHGEAEGGVALSVILILSKLADIFKVHCMRIIPCFC